jgi:hypothetical protein
MNNVRIVTGENKFKEEKRSKGSKESIISVPYESASVKNPYSGSIIRFANFCPHAIIESIYMRNTEYDIDNKWFENLEFSDVTDFTRAHSGEYVLNIYFADRSNLETSFDLKDSHTYLLSLICGNSGGKSKDVSILDVDKECPNKGESKVILYNASRYIPSPANIKVCGKSNKIKYGYADAMVVSAGKCRISIPDITDVSIALDSSVFVVAIIGMLNKEFPIRFAVINMSNGACHLKSIA